MTVFWIVMGVALVGGLFLAWRTDHKNKARRIALQGQTPGRMQAVRGDVEALRDFNRRPSAGGGNYNTGPEGF